MKNRLVWLLAFIIALFMPGLPAWAAVPVYVDGVELEAVLAADIKGNTLFAPIRPLAEKMGARVVYEDGQVSLYHEETLIRLALGSREAAVERPGGEPTGYQLSVAPYLKNGRLMLPLRFVAEQLGCKVSYEGVCVKLILPGDFINGQRAYTLALGLGEPVTGRKHIVNSCIAMLAECRGQEVSKPDNVVVKDEYVFYNRAGELIAHWRIWRPADVPHWPYGTLYLEDALGGQYYEADESVIDYYYRDDGKHLELEIAAFMGPKGSDRD